MKDKAVPRFVGLSECLLVKTDLMPHKYQGFNQRDPSYFYLYALTM